MSMSSWVRHAMRLHHYTHTSTHGAACAEHRGRGLCTLRHHGALARRGGPRAPTVGAGSPATSRPPRSMPSTAGASSRPLEPLGEHGSGGRRDPCARSPEQADWMTEVLARLVRARDHARQRGTGAGRDAGALLRETRARAGRRADGRRGAARTPARGAVRLGRGRQAQRRRDLGARAIATDSGVR